ncbi:hypothetical protein Ancab_030237 [Ancistrocladus abbreviatus]
MAFVSFVGRLLFASVFILSAFQEFNEFDLDGGPAAKTLRPKFNVFSKHVLSQTGYKLPPVDIKDFVAAAIALKGVGSLLSYLAVLLELIFCFCIRLLLLQSCMTSTTTRVMQKNFPSFLSNLLRIWHYLGHCSFSRA